MSLSYDPVENSNSAAQDDIPFEELLRRLFDQQWDEFLAYVLPCDASDKIVDLRYIGLDGKARYEVTWSTSLVTARQIIEHFVPQHLPMYDYICPNGEYTPYSPTLQED